MILKKAFPVKYIFLHLIGAFLFALLSVYIIGFNPWAGNWHSTTHALEAVSHSPYLSEDLSVRAHEYYHTHFHKAMHFLTQGPLGLNKTFFVCHFLTFMGFYFAIFLICRTLSHNLKVFFLSLCMLLLWKSRSLELNTLWLNDVFSANLFTHLVVLFEFGLLLRGNYVAAALCAGLGLYGHEQIALISFMVSTVYMLLNIRETGWKVIIRAIIVFSVFFIPVLVHLYPVLAKGAAYSGSFIDYTDFRAPHHNRFFSWNFSYILKLLLALAGGYIFIRLKSGRSDACRMMRKCLTLCLIIFGAALIHYGDFYWWKTDLITKLRLIRLSLFIHFFSVVCLAWLIVAAIEHPSRGINILALGIFGFFYFVLAGPIALPWQVWAAAAVPLSVAVYLTVRWRRGRFLFLIFLPAFFLTLMDAATLQLPGVKTVRFQTAFTWKDFYPVPRWDQMPWSWKNVCGWIDNHTEKDALFITPPQERGFTFYARRKSIVQFFASPGFDDSLKAEWYQRLVDLSGGINIARKCRGFHCLNLMREWYEKLTPDQVRYIARKYDAQYFLTKSDMEYPFETVYRNDHYKVYRVGEPRTAEQDVISDD